jgi:hypothetical protein
MPVFVVSVASGHDGNFNIENPPTDKVYLEPRDAWILMDMPEAKREIGFHKVFNQNQEVSTPYGTRYTVLSYLKYKILHFPPPADYIESIRDHLPKLTHLFKNTSKANASAAAAQNYGYEVGVANNIRSRLFAARALALLGEKDLAAAELNDLFQNNLITKDMAEDWKEAILMAFGPVEGRRRLMKIINRIQNPAIKDKFLEPNTKPTESFSCPVLFR